MQLELFLGEFLGELENNCLISAALGMEVTERLCPLRSASRYETRPWDSSLTGLVHSSVYT